MPRQDQAPVASSTTTEQLQHKKHSLLPQLPQEIGKCSRRGTPWCRCELVLSAHVPGWDLEDASATHLWLLGRLRPQQLWLHAQNEYKANSVVHELTQHPYIVMQPEIPFILFSSLFFYGSLLPQIRFCSLWTLLQMRFGGRMFSQTFHTRDL